MREYAENRWLALARNFHEENPEVYDQLVHYAREAARSGVRRIGIELIWNRMRWDHALRATDPNSFPYKLNQNYKAFYARLIMEREPDLEGLFELRELRAA